MRRTPSPAEDARFAVVRLELRIRESAVIGKSTMGRGRALESRDKLTKIPAEKAGLRRMLLVAIIISLLGNSGVGVVGSCGCTICAAAVALVYAISFFVTLSHSERPKRSIGSGRMAKANGEGRRTLCTKIQVNGCGCGYRDDAVLPARRSMDFWNGLMNSGVTDGLMVSLVTTCNQSRLCLLLTDGVIEAESTRD